MAEKILKLVGPAHIVGGLLLFLTAFLPFAQQQIASYLLFPMDQEAAFFLGVLGPTIASWGVLFTAIVRQFFASPSPRLWKAMVLSIAIWAPLDTALCWYYELWGAVVLNIVVVLVLAALLLSVKRRPL